MAPIHWGNHLLAFFLCTGVFFFGYLIPNHHHIYDPQLLTLLPLDESTPLLPWSILIYASEYIYFVVAYFTMNDLLTKNRYLYSIFFVELISIAFFVLYPVTYPRELYPLPENINGVISWIFNGIRMMDDPSNSFPSLHVGACFCTAWAFLKESRQKTFLFTLWAAGIALSTMTTKQHYFVDVLGGLFLASLGTWLFVYKSQYYFRIDAKISAKGPRRKSTLDNPERQK